MGVTVVVVALLYVLVTMGRGLSRDIHMGRRNGTDNRVFYFVSSTTVVRLLHETGRGM